MEWSNVFSLYHSHDKSNFFWNKKTLAGNHQRWCFTANSNRVGWICFINKKLKKLGKQYFCLSWKNAENERFDFVFEFFLPFLKKRTFWFMPHQKLFQMGIGVWVETKLRRSGPYKSCQWKNPANEKGDIWWKIWYSERWNND